MEQLLTTKEAARILGISTQTLSHWRYTKAVKIPYVQIGCHARYRQEDLEAFIKSNFREG